MSLESPNFIASGNIKPSRFVKITGDMTVAVCGSADVCFGVSQEGANSAPISDLGVTEYAASDGQNLRVFGPGEVCNIVAGAAVAAGAELRPDADGRGVAMAGAGNETVGAIALEAAGGAGQKIRCFVYRDRRTT